MSRSVQLFLHTSGKSSDLTDEYRRALSCATELLIVSAYLTNWNSSIPLNQGCERFRMIVGKDFGITRKAACEAAMNWVPARHKAHFRVADQIDGFHPKAVFWREADGKAFAIIGSSNLSVAAFESNYEANICLPICSADFDKARIWVDEIAALSVPMSPDWLENYRESSFRSGKRRTIGKALRAEVKPIHLPRPKGAAAAVRQRRKLLEAYRNNRNGLIDLFRQCSAGTIRSSIFFAELPNHWGGEVGGRLQGKGWERRGKGANFRALTESYLKIVDAKPNKRDDVVVAELDRLADQKNPARKAFLSEMLCLEFPELYPVLNKPVQRYLSDIKFRGSSGMSEGARYLDLALRLRLSLAQNPRHPAKNIAELDTVIWLAYPPSTER